MAHSVEREIGGKRIVIETGKYAEQASGAVTIRCGDTILLATVCVSPNPRPDIDFLPLTVDYEERLYATGKIPGSFFRREGRPGQDAILFCRLTDRPLRPLFPKGFHNEVQVILTVLSVDKENPPEILGLVAASAAVSISEIPFQGPVGATRISHAGGVYTLNPTYQQIDQSDLSAVVAGTKDAVMMVEAGATDVSEVVVLEAIRSAQDTNVQIVEMIEELVSVAGRPKMSFEPETSDDGLVARVDDFFDGRLAAVLEAGKTKTEREQALHALESEVQEQLGEEHSNKMVTKAFETIVKRMMRSRILDNGIRPDGRGLTDIRPISCEVGVLPRTHGSGLFKRGQTQVMTIATLGSVGMRQTLDNLSPDDTKRFIHHYNFTPYSTGEVKRVGSTGRREIGHGALAERALAVVVPSEEEFPYTIRLVSEVLSSNGSTSMASVCGSSLALMDAGVPLKNSVAGVAMGLIMSTDGKSAILTDIEGMEDHLGDMDFKVAGSVHGINALQMDVKVKGLSYEVLERALEQARQGRLFILDKMQEAISEPRPHLSQYAPKMIRITIPVSKIGAVIGPGGRMIRSIQEESGASIDVEDDGTVIIGSSDDIKINKARETIEGLTRDLVVGDIFTGKVVRITNFGAFVELVPGKDGLLRSSEMAEMENGLHEGQEITVMVQEVDHLGRINLSTRTLLDTSDGPSDTSAPRPPQGRPPYGSSGGGPGGDRRPPPRDGGFRSGPGQSRRPPPRSGFGGSRGR